MSSTLSVVGAPPGSPRPWSVRGAFTMVDVLVGLVVASVLVVAIGGVMVLASRAVPQSASAVTPTTVSAARIADDIAAELRYATGFTVMSPAAVEFSVPDRTGDSKPELIRFEWGGNKGNPITRQFNGGTKEAVAASADGLTLAYTKRVATVTKDTSVPVTSSPALLASFSGWSGVTTTSRTVNPGPSTWAGQAFQIPSGVVPVGATNISITSVLLRIKRPTSGGGDAYVSIHRRQSAGSHLPASMPVGTPATIPYSAMTTAFAMVPATFTDVVFPTLEQELAIVVKGSVTNAAQVSYLNSASAPVDTNVLRWSTDSGSSWLPSSGVDQNDAYYEVWGTWQTMQSQSVSTSTYYLTSVGVTVDTGGPAGVVKSVARVLNEPEVAGP